LATRPASTGGADQAITLPPRQPLGGFVVDVERMRLWYWRPQVRRVVLVLRWVILFGVLAGFFGWFSCAVSGGCAPSPPQMNPSDLSAATLTVMYPAAGGPPKKITIDMGDSTERSRLVDAYRSMTKWGQEGSARPPSPDYSLELVLKNGERIVIVMQLNGYSELVIRKYKGETLKSTADAQAGKMRDYLLAKGG
jgi:hypothetical protein